ncbi:MAG: zinc metallopeptidase [Anaerolineae bacterium]|nr:zinc metallopeptidase [Anaerolineae bacterium]
MLYLNPTYFIFVLPALLLAFYAQMKVRAAYSRYTRKANLRGITGLQAAQTLLPATGLGHVSVEGIRGELTDHYDPRSKTLRLSQGVAHVPSVAALAIVAHEIGHAQQDAQGYVPLKLRSGLVPAVQLSAWVGPILFMIGLVLNMLELAWLGVIAFAAGAVFALITLPVEFNASRRGLQLLRTYQLADGREMQEVKSVLNAAALTYVAALAQTLGTLLYYIFLLTGFGGRRRR